LVFECRKKFPRSSCRAVRRPSCCSSVHMCCLRGRGFVGVRHTSRTLGVRVSEKVPTFKLQGRLRAKLLFKYACAPFVFHRAEHKQSGSSRADKRQQAPLGDRSGRRGDSRPGRLIRSARYRVSLRPIYPYPMPEISRSGHGSRWAVHYGPFLVFGQAGYWASRRMKMSCVTFVRRPVGRLSRSQAAFGP
jgi:hypothetical protein